MKKIVIYKSKTGFAAKYAEWIAKALGCDIEELSRISAKKLQEYDIIIYGAGIMASMIYEMKKIKKFYAQMPSKKWIVYATGMTPGSDQGNYDNVKKSNFSDGMENVPFFYFQGGLNYEKMNFMAKKMLNMVGSMLEKKEDKTEEEAELAKKFGSSSDESKEEFIEPLVAFVHDLEAV